ncbi:hypothetical protein F5144DRAFT_650490 [Chaetomium tenue]|uniref:Uncharacterized protein n=1 Tax=Chaetomium tenue TaxID=1854479 RepID=A0ACB7P8B5_9PEZI|nr:hypothetical protein F5144DRAFT_650490 [Chaetomium globosum]
MLTPAHAKLWFDFYPMGNTPAVCLTQGLPPEKKADMLLLGCGDPRSILFTTHCDVPRSMDITCCDVETTILARNIILFTLILDDRDGLKSSDNWNIFYHLFLDQACHGRLLGHVKKLRALASTLDAWREGEYGKLIRFCDEGTLRRVAEALAFHLSAATEKQLWMKSMFKEAMDAHKRVGSSGYKSSTAGVRSATPAGVIPTVTLNHLHQHFWCNGSLRLDSETQSQTTFANPMFVSADATVKLHHGVDPLFGYHLAAAYMPFSSDTSLPQRGPKPEDVVAAAKVEFANWSNTFRSRAQHGLTLRFFSGDALLLCYTLQHRRVTGSATTAFHYRSRHETMEPLALVQDDYGVNGNAPVSFNVIDTSDLLDGLGGLNLLAATSPLLDGDASSTLYTDTLIQHGANSPKNTLTTSLAAISRQPLCSDKEPMHARIAWKRPPLSRGAGWDPLHIDPEELAALLYQIYVDMFPVEQLQKMLDKPSLEWLEYASTIRHTRPGFLALVALVKGRVVTDWDSVMKRLFALVMSDRSLIIGNESLPELFLYMHLLGLHSIGPMKSFAQRRATDPRPSPVLAGWENMPPSVCITLKVPRSALRPLTDPPAHIVGTTPLQVTMWRSQESPLPFEYTFAALQLGFGTLSTSGSRFTDSFAVNINEDPQGWHGDSPLFVTFRVPSDIILFEPQPTGIYLGIQATPDTAPIFFHEYKSVTRDMSLFKTTVGDAGNVYITRELPNLAKAMVIPGFAEDTFTAQGQGNSGITTTTTACTDHATSKVTSLSVRTNLLSGNLRAALTNGAAVQTTPASPCAFTVTIGTTHLTVTFPFPVLANTVKTLIARASGYIELRATILSDPAAHPSATFTAPLSFPPAPITTTTTNPQNNPKQPPTPICYTTPYTTLSTHPRLLLPPLPNNYTTTAPNTTTTNPNALSFLNRHTSQLFSPREFPLRPTLSDLPPTTTTATAASPQVRARVALKESLCVLFARMAGLSTVPAKVREVVGVCVSGGGLGSGGGVGGEGRSERLFALHDQAGSVDGSVMVFVSALRLDWVQRAVVLDCAVMVMTGPVFRRLGGYEGRLVEAACGKVVEVMVDAEEMGLWREVLPAWVERCRGGMWEHKEGCVYYHVAEGVWRAPVSGEMGGEVVCGCGKGVFPDGWGADVPAWELFRPHCVRAAIPALFASALAEDVIPNFRDLASAREEQETRDGVSVSACRNCGAEKSEDGKDLKSCGKCLNVKYCGQPCQLADWKRHKQECTPKK